jgi:hypothetical protein
MAEESIDRALAGIADRSRVDWEEIERAAGSDVDRDWLRWLRVLDGVAGVHPSIADTERPSELSTRPPDLAPESTGETHWGKYLLLEKVGEGGFGSVHRAWDPDLEIEVAIKILHRRFADARLKQALLQEGRALARITHENVVRVLGVESHDDQIALCMEFVRGETLEEVVQRHGTLNAREAALAGADVCRALAAVHLAGFVHRDVKARNVMREKAGRIVLMDFGAGQAAEDLKVPGKIRNVGTPIYMAPEVLAGEPATAASDVYSVGVLLYNLVTGEYPVDGRALEEVRLAHMQGRRRPVTERRPDIAAAFAQVVERALAPDAARRYPTAAALLEDLSMIFAGPAAGTHRSWDRARKTGVVVGSAATIALAVTALGATASVQFNTALGRSDFAHEGVADMFTWGLKSLFAPTAGLLQNLMILALGAVLRRLILNLWPSAAALETHLVERARARAGKLHVDDPQVLASVIVLLSVATLVGSWWYFKPIFDALFAHVSSVPAGRLAVLSPDFSGYRSLYRKTFFAVSNIAVVAWYVVHRVSTPKHGPFNWAASLGAGAVAVMAIASMELPYRTFLHSDFRIARWQGQRCYALGERGDEMLITCPALPSPRNRIVNRTSPDFELTGDSESLFAQFQELQAATAAGNR